MISPVPFSAMILVLVECDKCGSYGYFPAYDEDDVLNRDVYGGNFRVLATETVCKACRNEAIWMAALRTVGGGE